MCVCVGKEKSGIDRVEVVLKLNLHTSSTTKTGRKRKTDRKTYQSFTIIVMWRIMGIAHMIKSNAVDWNESL